MDSVKILLLIAFLSIQHVGGLDALLNPVKKPPLLMPVDTGSLNAKSQNVNNGKSSAKIPPLLLPPTLTGVVPPGGICSQDEDCSGFPFAYCMSNCMCKDYAVNAGSTCLEPGSMAEGNCGVEQVYVSEAGICMNVAKPGAPCQYSQQCSGTEVGAFCINMRCRCVYGMKTTDTGHCTFINTNCTRRGMIWIAELGECKAVVAPGARPCTHRQQCTASYQDSVCFMTQCTCPPETPIAVDGTCGVSCPAGSTYSGVLNRCVQAVQPGGRCQYSSQCHALNPGMVCQRGLCRCPKQYVWTGKQCAENCPEGYRENPSNGICRPGCREGQVEHNGNCLNQVPPDSACVITAQCTGGSSCTDGRCKCPYGMYNLQGVCSRAKSRPGGSCAKGEECTDNSYCLDGRCVCVKGTVLHNQRCGTPTIVPPDSVCGPMIECSGGSICINNVCTCPNGHISMNYQCQLPDAVPPGSACTDIDHCAGGSFCLYGTCRCPTGTVVMNRRCQIPTEITPGQKCQQNVDICTGRSLCVDGICQCPPHMVIERGICVVPAIVTPGSLCDKTRRCGGGSTCQMGICKCPEGMIIVDQRCQLAKTAPPSYSCRNGEICTGGSFCLNGICSCPKGQVPINEVCKSETAPPTGRCDDDNDCKNGFVCVAGRCSCSGMLLPNGQCKASRLVSPGGKCVLGMDICAGGSSCIDNVCACPAGLYPNGGRCRSRKRVPYSFTCSTSTECAGGANCNSGVCICPTEMLLIDGECQPLFVLSLNRAGSEPMSVQPNGSCQPSGKPLWSTCKSGDYCANGTECIDGVCQCPVGHIAVNLTCRLKLSVPPGEPCSPAEMCSDGAQCIRGKCVCPDGYDHVNRRCHSVKHRQSASPGEACGINTICTGGSSCRAGICKCSFGFEARQGMCVRRPDTISLARPGERCVQEATNCTGGSRCVFGTCKCPKGTVAKNKRCEAATTLSDWALPGQPCDADAECRGGSKCIGSLCTCPVNQVVINHECADAHVTVKPGYACDANSICTGGSTCTSGICRCPLGQSIEGHQCVTRMAIAKPGDLCNAHTMVCTGGSVCDGGKCACPPGHEITQTVCKNMWSKRAYPSTPGSFCRPDTAVCTGGSYCLNNVCVCPQGYFARVNQCLPKLNPNVDTIEGTPLCATNSQCQGGSICWKGTCQCPLSSKWNADRTVCVSTDPALLTYRGTTPETAIAPGRPCVKEQSYCTGGSYCKNGYCVCPSGTVHVRSVCQSLISLFPLYSPASADKRADH